MADNVTLKINPYTMDLDLDNFGLLETVSGAETSAQAVRLTLTTHKGAFPFDPEHGTEYERIMGRRNDELDGDEIDEVIRDAIFQEETVQQINSLDSQIHGRGLTIEFSGTLASGEVIRMEVAANE